MDSHENLSNINDTYDDSQVIEDMRSINITDKSGFKKPLNESYTLIQISESKMLIFIIIFKITL